MHTLDEFRQCIAEQSDTGMLIAADWCEEQPSAATNRMGRLLRAYCNVQTYVRMSLPIPHEIAAEFDELSKSFETPDHRDLNETGCYYSRPLGKFYTKLEVSQNYLSSNINLLSEEPVRDLTIRFATPNDDLALILRNYRIDYMERLTIIFQRHRTQAADLARHIRDLKSNMLYYFAIAGVDDRLKQVQVAFQLAKIRKGCELHLSKNPWGRLERIAVRR